MQLDIEKIKSIILEVGDFILEERKQFRSDTIEIKGLNDLVSYVDKTSENLLVEKLSQLLPASGFITEEEERAKAIEYNWIIDPLDGTTNFIHGIPHYAISVALAKHDEILFGAVYDIAQKEYFHAVVDKGAFLNNETIHVSNCKQLADALIATGFPVNLFDKMEGVKNTLDVFMRNTHGVRRIGAAAIDLCYLASGRVDAFYEYNLKPWDVAAGSLIAKEAGAVLSDFHGRSNFIYGKSIIGASPNLYDSVFKLVNENLAN
jgi:myo-inositol-1(or 4)-monophosphatase